MKIKLMVTLFCAATIVGLTACVVDPVEMKGGKLPDKEPLENTYGMLRSGITTENSIDVMLSVGNGFVTRDFYFQQTKPAESATSLKVWADPTLLDAYNAEADVERKLLPEANYEFPDGQNLDLSPEAQTSAWKRIRFLSAGLEAGEYVLPLTAANADTPDKSKTLYYNVTVRQPYAGEHELHDGHDLFFVFYINTNQLQPLLAQDYILLKKLARGSTVAWEGTVGNIINLRTVRLDYESTAKRAILKLGADMTYVLNHTTKYILPLQDQGRKVCISIEGGGTGLGFCNLTDAQITDFTAQIKAVVETYNLDGINLWDRNSSYGKEGMPAMNTTSYPKLIKALREALGAEKLLTVTVYDKPTETFYDIEATGGIAVGDYIDYAWSGYNKNSEAPQLLDPWHPELEYVSAYTQKPIANLPKEHYGCINFPMYPRTTSPEEAVQRDPAFLVNWVQGAYQPNGIIVFDDLRANLQDNYETVWDFHFSEFCTYMDAENKYILGSRKGYSYTFLNHNLSQLPNGIAGYGKWQKDW